MRTAVFRPELLKDGYYYRNRQTQAFVEAMKEKTAVLVARSADGERVVGSADLQVEGVASRGATAAYIVNVCVSSEARRQGLGRRLVTAAEERATSAGANVAVLHVDLDNRPARNLYTAMGYHEGAEPSLTEHFMSEGFCDTGSDAPQQLLMSKPLGVGATVPAPLPLQPVPQTMTPPVTVPPRPVPQTVTQPVTVPPQRAPVSVTLPAPAQVPAPVPAQVPVPAPVPAPAPLPQSWQPPVAERTLEQLEQHRATLQARFDRLVADLAAIERLEADVWRAEEKVRRLEAELERAEAGLPAEAGLQAEARTSAHAHGASRPLAPPRAAATAAAAVFGRGGRSGRPSMRVSVAPTAADASANEVVALLEGWGLSAREAAGVQRRWIADKHRDGGGGGGGGGSSGGGGGGVMGGDHRSEDGEEGEDDVASVRCALAALASLRLLPEQSRRLIKVSGCARRLRAQCDAARARQALDQAAARQASEGTAGARGRRRVWCSYKKHLCDCGVRSAAGATARDDDAAANDADDDRDGGLEHHSSLEASSSSSSPHPPPHPPPLPPPPPRRVLALDCETRPLRVAVVEAAGGGPASACHVARDVLVPDRHSFPFLPGVLACDRMGLEFAPLADTRSWLLAQLTSGCTVVGHTVWSDLAALRIDAAQLPRGASSRIVDVARADAAAGRIRSLRAMARDELGIEMHGEGERHCALQDAEVALRLWQQQHADAAEPVPVGS